MGMPIVVDVRDDGADADGVDALFDWLRWVDATFSTYKPDSEISRLDRGELALEDAHPDVREVLDRCEELRDETRGYFDARASAAGSTLRASSRAGRSTARRRSSTRPASRNYAVNAGGDIRLRGRRAPGAALARRDPAPARAATAVAAVVEANDLAVATSGAYARGDHVSTRTRRAPPRASSRSRSPGPTSRPPTRTPPPRSRWASAGPPGRRGCAATRR